MLSCGRWIVSSPVSSELSGTGSPLMVTVAVIPASAPTAHARSSASVVPLPSKVLHSVVHAAMKILVPALTVHVNEPPPNGATILPPTTTHWGPPPPNGLSGVGVSRTVVHKCPKVFPRLVGAALADGATKQTVTAARSSARARRAMRSPSARNRADRLVSLVPSALVSTLSLAPPRVKSPQLVSPSSEVRVEGASPSVCRTRSLGTSCARLACATSGYRSRQRGERLPVARRHARLSSGAGVCGGRARAFATTGKRESERGAVASP